MSRGLNRFKLVRHQIEGAVDLTIRRAWFADDAQPTGGDNPAAQPDQAAELPDWVKDPAKAYAEITKLREENAKTRTTARDVEKRLEAIEKARQLADEQQLVDQNKWKEIAEKREKELLELQTSLQKTQAEALRTRIASELGLPAALAARLQGATEEEMRADAETLKAAIPQAPGAPRTGSTTTAVPGGQPAKETDAQRRARLNGGGSSNLFEGGRIVLPE